MNNLMRTVPREIYQRFPNRRAAELPRPRVGSFGQNLLEDIS